MYKFFKQNNQQIFRFIVSGLIASIINFVVYNSVYLIFNHIIFASLCGYLSGILASFIFAKNWVFNDKSKLKVFDSFLIFCMIYFLGFIEMSTLIFFINKLIGNHILAWFIGALIGSLNNYLGSKYFLFDD